MIYVRNQRIDLKEIIFDYSVKHFQTTMIKLHRLDGYAFLFERASSHRLEDRFYRTKYDFFTLDLYKIQTIYNSRMPNDIL